MSKTLQEILNNEWSNDVKAQEIRILILERLIEALEPDDEFLTVIQRFNKKVSEL